MLPNEKRYDVNRVRLCQKDEFRSILAIINAAAERYRGVIPTDCWHEPYMSAEELFRETTAGVVFRGVESDNKLVGVIGLQYVENVALVRHAYVLPDYQRHGVGTVLLSHLRSLNLPQLFVGTWTDANWAIRFYERNRFELVSREVASVLLQTYWSVPKRQIEASVVLAFPGFKSHALGRERP
jgi:GNAT superfamily N-acetyltransferase